MTQAECRRQALEFIANSQHSGQQEDNDRAGSRRLGHLSLRLTPEKPYIGMVVVHAIRDNIT
jgi:hypothetical protein